MQNISIPIAPNKSFTFRGTQILKQRLNPVGSVEAYTTASDLIVFVRYPDFQPTDEIHIGTDHAVIPLVKLYRAAGRGRLLKKLLGGPATLIYERLHGNYPILMIGELLDNLDLGRAS